MLHCFAGTKIRLKLTKWQGLCKKVQQLVAADSCGTETGGQGPSVQGFAAGLLKSGGETIQSANSPAQKNLYSLQNPEGGSDVMIDEHSTARPHDFAGQLKGLPSSFGKASYHAGTESVLALPLLNWGMT
jgi:hypothetical protein